MIEPVPVRTYNQVFRTEGLEYWGPSITTLTDDELLQRDRADV